MSILNSLIHLVILAYARFVFLRRRFQIPAAGDWRQFLARTGLEFSHWKRLDRGGLGLVGGRR
jgi:hypothetical protein